MHEHRSDRVTSQVIDGPQQIEGFGHPRLVLLRFKERQRFLIGEQGLGPITGAHQPVECLRVVVAVSVVERQLTHKLVQAVGIQRFDGFADSAMAGAAL